MVFFVLPMLSHLPLLTLAFGILFAALVLSQLININILKLQIYHFDKTRDIALIF